MKLLHDFILVKCDKPEGFLSGPNTGSVIIPDNFADRPGHGVVKSVGEKVETVKPGDRVYWNKYDGFEMDKEDDHVILLLHENDIQAKE